MLGLVMILTLAVYGVHNSGVTSKFLTQSLLSVRDYKSEFLWLYLNWLLCRLMMITLIKIKVCGFFFSDKFGTKYFYSYFWCSSVILKTFNL